MAGYAMAKLAKAAIKNKKANLGVAHESRS